MQQCQFVNAVVDVPPLIGIPYPDPGLAALQVSRGTVNIIHGPVATVLTAVPLVGGEKQSPGVGDKRIAGNPRLLLVSCGENLVALKPFLTEIDEQLCIGRLQHIYSLAYGTGIFAFQSFIQVFQRAE